MAGAGNHVVFDNNGAMNTAVVLWNKSTGNVSITNTSAIKIIAITILE